MLVSRPRGASGAWVDLYPASVPSVTRAVGTPLLDGRIGRMLKVHGLAHARWVRACHAVVAPCGASMVRPWFGGSAVLGALPVKWAVFGAFGGNPKRPWPFVAPHPYKWAGDT